MAQAKAATPAEAAGEISLMTLWRETWRRSLPAEKDICESISLIHHLARNQCGVSTVSMLGLKRYESHSTQMNKL